MASDTPITSRFDSKTFLHGLLIVTLAYVALFAFFWAKGPARIAELEEQLASQTVEITRKQIATAPEPEIFATKGVPPIDAVDLDVPPQPERIALPKAPIDGLYEQTDLGRLPHRRSGDKLTPFEAYSRPFALPADRPIIAVAVAGYGLSENASQTALGLPPEITFLLSPYSLEPERWTAAAREEGHEVWLDVKFETSDFPDSDPGPQALLANSSLPYNQERLYWNLSRASGYSGIAGRTDYVFDSATAILNPLMKMLYHRGIGFLELNPDASSIVETIAAGENGPYARANLLINDNDDTMQGSPLKNLERIASEKGYAIGILNPYEQSIEQIRIWMDGLAAKGYVLAPVSAVAKLKMQPAVQGQAQADEPG